MTENEDFMKWQSDAPTKVLPLTSEYIFKRFFSKEENVTMLKDFLEAIIERKITNIIVLNPEIPKDLLDSKMGILDLKVKLETNEIIDVELEMKNEFNIKKRSNNTLTGLISEQLNSEYAYTEKKKIITIHLFNFNYFQRNSYHSIAKMKFDKSTDNAFVNLGYEQEEEIATDIIEMHFIEIPKFIQKCPNVETKLEQWLWLLAGCSQERLKMATLKNKEIEKAVEVLEELSKNKDEQELYECMKKAELEYIETVDYFTRKRIKEGMEKGENKEKVEIAKRMLQEKIALEMIMKVTKLNKNDLEKLEVSYID